MTLNSEGLEKTWRFDIQHGPEGEAAFAWVYAGKDLVATMRTHHAESVVEAMNRRALPPVDGLEVVAWKMPGAKVTLGKAGWAFMTRHENPEDYEPGQYEALQAEIAAAIPLVALSQASSVIAGLKDERDEAIRRGEDQWAGWVKEEVARKAAEARISSLEEEIKRLREIVKAVAHIGVDFGFGPYELEHHFIEDARQTLEDHNG